MHVNHNGTDPERLPSDFHRRLKARAAMEGMSMSDYILREMGKALERPTRQEVLERLRSRPIRHVPTRALPM